MENYGYIYHLNSSNLAKDSRPSFRSWDWIVGSILLRLFFLMWFNPPEMGISLELQNSVTQNVKLDSLDLTRVSIWDMGNLYLVGDELGRFHQS